MKKLLLWIVMVVGMTVILLGGTFAAFYMAAGEQDLPDSGVTLGQTTLEPIGYDWSVPVLGGVVNRQFYSAPTLTVQKLGDVGEAVPQLHLPTWAAQTKLQLTAPDGSVALEGTAADYAGYTFLQNGRYEIALTLSRAQAGQPAQPTGWYRYCAEFSVSIQPTVVLNTTSAVQGGVVAVFVTGILDGSTPTVQTDLGTVWMRPCKKGWMGYLPVTYNAEAGPHTITVSSGEQEISTLLNVTQQDAITAATQADDRETDASAQEYRNEIWPLYTAAESEKLWNGAFTAPVASGVRIGYGSRLTVDGESAGRATAITYNTADAEVCAPQAGKVVLAGTLALTGGTVVIDHGCGVKSYLYGLTEMTVQKGDLVAAAQAVGRVSEGTPLVYELRIGSKTVDPAPAIKGSSGLQYRETA